MAQNPWRCSLNLPQASPGLDQTTARAVLPVSDERWRSAVKESLIHVGWEKITPERTLGRDPGQHLPLTLLAAGKARVMQYKPYQMGVGAVGKNIQ